jgi:hypothetical protein
MTKVTAMIKCAALFLCVGTLVAADEGSDSSVSGPITAKMTATQAGKDLALSVTLKISPPAHIYAPSEPAGRFTPVSILLDLPAGVSLEKSWRFPNPINAGGDRVYIGTLQAHCLLTVPSKLAGSTLHIRASLRYQACTDDACWPVASLPLSATIHFDP